MMNLSGMLPIQAAQTPLPPAAVEVRGFWGQQLQKTCDNWMLKVNNDLLLSGFRSKPGMQPWIGEHIGKFLLAAIPTDFLLHKPELQAKSRFLVESLVALQEEDGYLGTLLPAQRWYNGLTDHPPSSLPLHMEDGVWDVWVHKYCILALLDYYQASGWKPALQAATRAADRVIAVFGPGGQDINHSDCHSGLASGSFLEPLMRLYQLTHFPRYLEFARQMLRGWEDPAGPRILTVLKQGGDVASIGRGKAYEMMSCFVGLVEYARAAGDREILQLVLQARDHIADGHRYVTGGMSNTEFFWRTGLFPEWSSMETCVTFTWIQLNLRLYELTGDACALDLVEEAAWNQLLPALSPMGDTWSYHLSLSGPKRFFRKWIQGVASAGDLAQGAPVSCCHTNGQRGLALIPQYAYSVGAEDTLSVNFYGDWDASVTLPGCGSVRVEQRSDFPAGDGVAFRFIPETDQPYRVRFRVPGWASEMQIDGQPAAAPAQLIELSGEREVRVVFNRQPRIILGGYESRGKCAVAFGPLVYALDKPQADKSLDSIVLNLGSGDPRSRLRVRYVNGWPILQAPAYSIPVQSSFQPAYQNIGSVELLPVLLAGLKDNPGLSETLDGESMPAYNQEKVPIRCFPEYRVLLPFFWLPE